jgi:hypothetical protein
LTGSGYWAQPQGVVVASGNLRIAICRHRFTIEALMKAVNRIERRAGYSLVLGFVILSLGIVAGGVFCYRQYEREFRAGIEQQLSAIAELKASELAQYRQERLGDAAVFFKNIAFSGLVRVSVVRNAATAGFAPACRRTGDKYSSDFSPLDIRRRGLK